MPSKFLANVKTDGNDIIDVWSDGKRGKYIKVIAINRSNDLNGVVAGFGQMVSIAMASTLLTTFKEQFSFMFRGRTGNTISNFLREAFTGDFPILTGPIMERDDMVLFCDSIMCLSTAELVEFKKDGIKLGELIKATG